MRARFICPHCRVAVDPAAMEESRGDSAEFRVCPYCDAPVVFAVRDGQAPQRGVAAARAVKSTPDGAGAGAPRPDSRQATA